MLYLHQRNRDADAVLETPIGASQRRYPMTKPHLTLPELTPQEIARFWSKVDQSGECWLWTAGRSHGLYGMFSVSRDKRQRHLGAHRVAYELTYGPLGAGLLACHRCDTPACVRPDHLFPGTYADNMHDMIAKGRAITARQVGRPGEQNANAKLSDDDVRTILDLARGKQATQRQIAKRFGVSAVLISKICRGRIWRHISAEFTRDVS